MSGVVRKTDNCSGHATYAPRPPITWSPDVFVNTLNVIRYGDSWSVHCCPVCHGGSSVGGGDVYVNGNVLQIQGDPIDCGSTCAECSNNVFAKG
jgi:uncharacterized Zn-binding protein involved in type VI secretion